MLRFYYNAKYKYTNRTLIDLTDDINYKDIDYVNIDSPDTINGHLIYVLEAGENVPTYILDLDKQWRYFVSGITQLRTGKYQISLLRDICSESKLWTTEDAYIQAGTATDFNRYKKWGLPFTNTKIQEQRLNINGKSSFFVYYVNTQHIAENKITESDLHIENETVPDITSYDYIVDNFNDIPSGEYINAGPAVNRPIKRLQMKARLNAPAQPSGYIDQYITFYQNPATNGGAPDITISNSAYQPFINDAIDIRETRSSSIIDNINNCETDTITAMGNFLESYYNSQGVTRITNSQVQELDAYIGKIIYNRATNQVVRINKTETLNASLSDVIIPTSQASTLISSLRNINYPTVGSTPNTFEIVGSDGYFLADASTANDITYTAEVLGTGLLFDFNFIADTRKLPKSAVRCVNIVPNNDFTVDDIAQCLMLAQINGINAEGDTGRILDIQYLPFSVADTPNDNIKINNTSLVARFLTTDDLYFSTQLPQLTNINKETDTIKIVSPSRASQFIFSPYNNDGLLEFQSRITLKPYTTAIYIRPSTQGLLLYDWDDKDCLTILEDFSLTNVSSEWTNYIYNNRNYQNAFEREIQGREFGREWERKVEQAQARADEWTARNISAQKTQTYTGNLPIVSSVLGAFSTAAPDYNYMQAAQLDRQYNEALYQEGLSQSRDLFNMQIENIQAQPPMPSRITTIDIKLLDGVYLEFYSTNSTEKQAIDNYYKFNGNRIDCYGTFDDYYGHFVRGKIIKANNYTQPELNELNRRLEMGIYTEVQL